MRTVHALELRRSLGRVLDHLERHGHLIPVLRHRIPVAVLVNLKNNRERFLDGKADERRRRVVARLKKLEFASPPSGTTLDLLRDLRS